MLRSGLTLKCISRPRFMARVLTASSLCPGLRSKLKALTMRTDTRAGPPALKTSIRSSSKKLSWRMKGKPSQLARRQASRACRVGSVIFMACLPCVA